MKQLPTAPSEPPRFWSRIANDSTYGRFHRRRAVFQLFRRHLQAGMRLSDLARLLNHPTWLRASDIHLVTHVLGSIPVELNARDTVFVIRVLPETGRGDQAIYLRVAGKVLSSQFTGLLLGTQIATNETGSVSVEEIGLCENSGEKPCEHRGGRA